jgi:hypothetical protein
MTHSQAMDESARRFNEFGWMTIEGNPITKVGVFPYLGKQIGAPEPDRVYMVYRPEEELNNPETIESFKLTPFINEHPEKLLGNVGSLVKTDNKRIEGVFGEKVYFEYPMLRANLRVYSADALDSIELGKEELSAGYTCQWVRESGVFEGKSYDYVQRRIRGNHGALVIDGRSGPEIAVMDHMTFKLDSKEQQMDLAELVKAVAALTEAQTTFHGAMDAKISGIEAKVAAMDSDGEEDDKGKKKDDAMDEGDNEKEELKEALDAAIKRIGQLEARPAAMDSGALMAEIAKKNELASRLSQHIGSFAHDSMSLDQVAEYGAEKLGLPKDSAAIRVESYLMGKPAPTAYGMDAASAAKSTGAAFLAAELK